MLAKQQHGRQQIPRAIMSKTKGTPPPIAGVTTALAESPQSPARPRVTFAESALKQKMPSSAPPKLASLMSRINIDSDDDDETVELNCQTGVLLEPGQGLLDLFIVNPPVFKADGKRYAILAMHVPHTYNEDRVQAVITKDGRRCEITFTKPLKALRPTIVSLDINNRFGRNSALFQAINDWKEAQQDHAADDIKHTISFRLPFQSMPNFSTTLFQQGGYINAIIKLDDYDYIRQLVFAFEEKTNNTFERETAVTTTIDFSNEVRNGNCSTAASHQFAANQTSSSSSTTQPITSVQQKKSTSTTTSTPTTNNLSVIANVCAEVAPLPDHHNDYSSVASLPMIAEDKTNDATKRNTPDTPSESDFYERNSKKGRKRDGTSEEGSFDEDNSMFSFETFETVGKSLVQTNDDISFDY